MSARFCLGFAFATLTSLVMAPPVLSQEKFVPEVKILADPVSIEDRNIDILGLVPGMNLEVANELIAQHYNGAQSSPRMTAFVFRSRGVSVETEKFVESIAAGGNDDGLSASFVGPAADNQIYLVKRTVRYNDVLTAPTVETIAQALIDKYGAASFVSMPHTQIGPNNTGLIAWTYSGGAQQACRYYTYGSGPSCPQFFNTYTPDSLERSARDNHSFDVTIVAKIQVHREDWNKVRSFEVQVADMSIHKAAALADSTAIIDELERIHQSASTPASAPKL